MLCVKRGYSSCTIGYTAQRLCAIFVFRALCSADGSRWVAHCKRQRRTLEFIPMLIKLVPSIPPDPITNLIPNITRILEMDLRRIVNRHFSSTRPMHTHPTKDSAVAILLDSVRDTRDPPRNHRFDAGDVATQLNVNLIAAVPCTNDSACSCTKSGVREEVVLVIGRGIQKRGPGEVCVICTGGGVDVWISDCGDRAPGIVVVSIALSARSTLWQRWAAYTLCPNSQWHHWRARNSAERRTWRTQAHRWRGYRPRLDWQGGSTRCCMLA